MMCRGHVLDAIIVAYVIMTPEVVLVRDMTVHLWIVHRKRCKVVMVHYLHNTQVLITASRALIT